MKIKYQNQIQTLLTLIAAGTTAALSVIPSAAIARVDLRSWASSGLVYDDNLLLVSDAPQPALYNDTFASVSLSVPIAPAALALDYKLEAQTLFSKLEETTANPTLPLRQHEPRFLHRLNANVGAIITRNVSVSLDDLLDVVPTRLNQPADSPSVQQRVNTLALRLDYRTRVAPKLTLEFNPRLSRTDFFDALAQEGEVDGNPTTVLPEEDLNDNGSIGDLLKSSSNSAGLLARASWRLPNQSQLQLTGSADRRMYHELVNLNAMAYEAQIGFAFPTPLPIAPSFDIGLQLQDFDNLPSYVGPSARASVGLRISPKSRLSSSYTYRRTVDVRGQSVVMGEARAMLTTATTRRVSAELAALVSHVKLIGSAASGDTDLFAAGGISITYQLLRKFSARLDLNRRENFGAPKNAENDNDFTSNRANIALKLDF